MNNKDISKALKATTDKSRVKFRVGFFNKAGDKACMLAYVDARFVMDRLDNVLGSENWSTDYSVIGGKLFCTIIVHWPDGQVTKKSDCGMETEVDAEKGQASDAFKRAAVHYGIARDLYSYPKYWADANNHYVKPDWQPEGWLTTTTNKGTMSSARSNNTQEVPHDQPSEPVKDSNQAQDTIDRIIKMEEKNESFVEPEPNMPNVVNKPELSKETPPEGEIVGIDNLMNVKETDKAICLIPPDFKGDKRDYESTKNFWIPKRYIHNKTLMPSGLYNIEVEKWIAQKTDVTGKFVYKAESLEPPF